MNKINVLGKIPGRRPAKTVVLLALVMLVSGCYYTSAKRDFDRDGVSAALPWWCAGGATVLTQAECLTRSLSFDAGVVVAGNYQKLGAFTAAGGTEIALANRPTDIGVAYTKVVTPTTFDPNAPNVLLYDGTNTATSRLVGVAWEVNTVSAPDGFVGDLDDWSQNGSTGHWWLTAWVVRGHENQPNVFAASHPCLTSTGSILTATTDTCFTTSHPEPFEVLVVNDDGYAAPGIGALVDGVYALPNVTVHVVAPLTNQSGGGENITKPPYVISGSAVVTSGSKPAIAVSSNDPVKVDGSGWPADATLYAIKNLQLSPELVLSGINAGQNMGPVVSLSGTVGAARRARSIGIPAIATSQGFGNDFPSGVVATLALLEEWRLGRTDGTVNSVLNINIPSCTPGAGSIRGTKQTVVAPDMLGRGYGPPDCTSVVTTINDDVDAFNHGFIGIADVGVTKPPNWP